MLCQANIYNPPYSERYPFLHDYLDPIVEGWEWSGMRNNVISGNLIVNSKRKACALVGPHAPFEWINNRETDSDPGFVDMRQGNFCLRKDVPVFQKIKGFEPL